MNGYVAEVNREIEHKNTHNSGSGQCRAGMYGELFAHSRSCARPGSFNCLLILIFMGTSLRHPVLGDLMHYFSIRNNQLAEDSATPTDAVPFARGIAQVLPPQISDLHLAFREWNRQNLSPGQLAPERIWIGQDNRLLFSFRSGERPQPTFQVGPAPDLAAWLVLLDCWMETFVVVARARAVWSVAELAGALTFMTPAFLPPAIVNMPQANWQQMAMAIATAVADGPLAGTPEDRHWREIKAE